MGADGGQGRPPRLTLARGVVVAVTARRLRSDGGGCRGAAECQDV